MPLEPHKIAKNNNQAMGILVRVTQCQSWQRIEPEWSPCFEVTLAETLCLCVKLLNKRPKTWTQLVLTCLLVTCLGSQQEERKHSFLSYWPSLTAFFFSFWYLWWQLARLASFVREPRVDLSVPCQFMGTVLAVCVVLCPRKEQNLWFSH